MNTKDMIEVMQAFESGQSIECHPVGSSVAWGSTIEPVWNFKEFEYRVAMPNRQGWVQLGRAHS